MTHTLGPENPAGSPSGRSARPERSVGRRPHRNWGWLGRRPIRHVFLWIVSVVCVALIGASGYMVFERWSFHDALYMAVITLTTVGFKEVHPMHWHGELWTMALSVAAIGIIFGTVGVVAENLVAAVTGGYRESRRMQKQVAAMNGHFIVCGFGRVGSHVAKELIDEGEQVVVVDVRDDSLHRARDAGYAVVPGNGTTDEVLRAAGVTRARGLVTCIDSDPENVYVTLTARALNPELYIVGRASSSEVMKKLHQAGADHAVSPYVMAGHRITSLSLRPGVVDFIDAALNRIDMGFSVQEMRVTKGDSLDRQNIGDLRKRGLFVLAIRYDDGAYEPNPADERFVSAGQHLIVSGANSVLEEFE